MKKITFVKFGLALLIAAALSSCSLLSVAGTVIDAKAAAGSLGTLDGATVTLTGDKGIFTGNVVSGSYIIDLVPDGTYTINVTKSGYAFLPETFTVSGLFVTAPDVIGFPAPSVNSVLVLLKWENKSRDLDLHAVAGADNDWTTLDGNDNVKHVYYGNTSYATNGYDLTLDRDITEGNIAANIPLETISISDSAAATTPEEVRFYVHSYSTTNGLTGGINGGTTTVSAKAKVYAIQYEPAKSGTKETVLGIWTLPTDTLETSLRVFKLTLDEVSGLVFDNLVTDTVNLGAGVVVRSGTNGVIGIPSQIK